MAETDPSTPMGALEEAIAVCEGVGALASAISTEELPVSQSKVSMWRTRGSVPPEYAPAIYRATLNRGRPVTVERLAPRVDWAILRDQAAQQAGEVDSDAQPVKA